MPEITSLLGLRHLRSEASSHILLHRAGARRASGRGLSFWFLPLSASIAEIPMDDRELALVLHGRSLDFQEVTVQLVLIWRVHDPERMAERVDFSVDLRTGQWTKQPLEKLTSLLAQRAQQVVGDYLVRSPLQLILTEGVAALLGLVRDALQGDEGLAALGVAVPNVAVSSVRASPDVEKALQTPQREAIQQESDKATFERRAMAVERERAIAENELQNRIALARREEQLIDQQGQNNRRKATEEAQASRIKTEAAAAAERLKAETEATGSRLKAEAEAAGIQVVEGSRVEAERARIAIYRDLPQAVMMGLAARELASNLPDIQTLHVSPDALGDALTRWLQKSGEAA